MPHSIDGSRSTFPATDLWLFVALCLPLFVLNILRIVSVPVTYDEALTFNAYVSKSVTGIIRFDEPAPNNHLLNTLLTKLFTDIISNNVFFLRLANLLGQVIYLFFSFKVCRWFFSNKALLISSFVLLNLQPFLFEFFGLCRGYGLSLSLMLGCIYFLLRYMEYHKPSALITSLCYCILSVYANLSLLNFFFGIVAVIVLDNLMPGRIFSPKRFRTEALLLLSAGGLLFLLLSNVLTRLIEAKQLYYGGDTGFFHDTIQTLVQDSFYIRNSERMVANISIVIVASVAVVLFSVVFGLIIRKERYRYVFLFSVLLIIPALSTQLQHALLGTKLLISRTALFYLPLYLLLLLSFVHAVGKAELYIIGPLALLSLFVFARNYNVDRTSTWDFDRYDLAVMEQIASGPKGKDISIGSYRLFTPVIHYYSDTRFKGKIGVIENVMEYHTTDTAHDYYYIPKAALANMPGTYKVVAAYGDEFTLITRLK